MKDMKQLFSIPDDEEVRLWNQFAKGTYELITAKPSTTLQDCSISSGQVFGYLFGICFFEVSYANTRTICEICPKLIKVARIVSLLLTLNRFYLLFWCSHCWLWKSNCRLDILFFEQSEWFPTRCKQIVVQETTIC